MSEDGKSWRDVPSAEPWGRAGLSARGRAVARAAAEAALCTRAEGGGLVAPDAAWVDRVVDDYDCALGHASRPIRLGVNALLVAFDYLAAPVCGGLSPMRSRSLEGRLAYLDRMEHHDRGVFTMAWIAIKVPLLVSAFEEGEPLRMTGFDRESTFARRLPLHPAPDATDVPLEETGT